MDSNDKPGERLQNDKAAIQHLVSYTKHHNTRNGGREWVNTVDGLKQYPDMRDLKMCQLYMIAAYAPVNES